MNGQTFTYEYPFSIVKLSMYDMQHNGQQRITFETQCCGINPS